jgi:pimeloyl-ACP methyl ester carboxylesterase
MAFGHNPTKYAKKITCPTFLLYGSRDEKVSRQEIDEIFANLKGKKEIKVYEAAGHENYLTKYKEGWKSEMERFLAGSNEQL